MTDATQRIFVSYAGRDGAWAEWVGWQLKRAGHQVERCVLDEKHPDVMKATLNLAATLTAMGRTYEAQQLTSRKPKKGKRRFGRKRR